MVLVTETASGVTVMVEVVAAGVTVTCWNEEQSARRLASAVAPIAVPVTARAQLSWREC